MTHRLFFVCGLIAALSLGLGSGCGKSPSSSSETDAAVKSGVAPAAKPEATQAPVLRLHWSGTKRLVADGIATNLLAMGELPETQKLKVQTLDKLATAPWRFWATPAAVSNAPVALVRPLLDDLVQEESYLEIQAVADESPQMVLALRLPADRAALWETNLPLIIESMAGGKQASNSVVRAGDWTLVAGPLAGANKLSSASLLTTFRERITATGIPHVSRTTNDWLELVVDLRRLNEAFHLGWDTTLDLPRVTLDLTGDGLNVRTTGELEFSRKLPLVLEAWNIPTNVIYDPLLSFTAMRGVAPAIDSWSFWQQKKLGTAPNQIFFWAQAPALWQHFVTYPMANASNHNAALGDYVLNDLNPIFLTNKVGKFEWDTNNLQRLVWRGVPFFQPTLARAKFNETDFTVFGLFANNATNRPVPASLFAQFNNRSNLIYYDWEITGPQVTSWTQMGQLTRMVFGRVQLSPVTASLPWLRAITPKLGNATTVLTLEAPERISLKRSSSCGLTAVELHLLADWLESPQFPVGLHTQLAQRKVRPLMTTNAPAAP